MLRHTSAFASPAFALALLASPAAAVLPQRTFVASYGLSANTAFNCSIAKPCRAFGEAIGVTNSGGEVIVLDSAGYGSVTITKSVSIIAPPGIYAGVSVISGDGIIINAPGGNVVLRGLSISGLGGSAGINIASATSVELNNIMVSNMGTQGVVTSGGALTISGSAFLHNGGDGISQLGGTLTLENVRSEGNAGRGLYVPTGTASIDSSSFQKNSGEGIRVEDGGRVSVQSSVVSGNQLDGVFVDAIASNVRTYVQLDDCMIDANGASGVEAHASGVAGTQVNVSGGHVNYNANRGLYPTSLTAAIIMTRVTVWRNAFLDVDFSAGKVYTYSTSTVNSTSVSSPNLTVVSGF